MALENFTGKSVESIYQDFWSTVFISNLETILTEDIEAELNTNEPTKHKKRKVNKAVSFNAIKNMAFKIFQTEWDQEKILDKLMELFVMNPILVRENREVPRKHVTDTQLLNFYKRVKKQVF